MWDCSKITAVLPLTSAAAVTAAAAVASQLAAESWPQLGVRFRPPTHLTMKYHIEMIPNLPVLNLFCFIDTKEVVGFFQVKTYVYAHCPPNHPIIFLKTKKPWNRPQNILAGYK